MRHPSRSGCTRTHPAAPSRTRGQLPATHPAAAPAISARPRSGVRAFTLQSLQLLQVICKYTPLFSFPHAWLFSVASLRALYINAFSVSEKAKRPRAQINFPRFLPDTLQKNPHSYRSGNPPFSSCNSADR